METTTIALLAAVLVACPAVSSKRVLMLSVDVWSHIIKPLNIAKHLENYGHTIDIVLASPKFEDKVKKFGVKGLTVKVAKEKTSTILDNIQKDLLQGMCENTGIYSTFATNWARIKMIKNMPAISMEECSAFFTNKKLMTDLQEASYDVVIGDSHFASDTCHCLIAYKLGAPIIFVGTLNIVTRYGIPVFPAATSVLGFKGLGFFARVFNFVLSTYLSMFPSVMLPNSFITDYISEKPAVSYHTLVQNASMYIIDQDPIMDFPRPSMPHVKFIGGLATGEGAALPDVFKSWMDGATNGAVVVSFGSILNINLLKHIDKIVMAMSMVPELRFVFRYPGHTENVDSNVMKAPWLPQNDLLSHTNTKLFITHCGNNGRMEALFHGVPMIGLPFGGDQLSNCQQIQTRNYGKCLSFCEITAEDLVKAIREVISGNCTDSIKRASKLFRSPGTLPSERAAVYIDRFLNYGADWYRNPALDLPWYSLHSADVITFLLAICVLFLYISCRLCRFLCSKINSKVKKD